MRQEFDSPIPHPKFHMKQDLNKDTQKILIDKNKIPKYVTHVTNTLQKAGFEAFVVGGSVRDLLIGREVKDWDMTTNAKPDEIIKLFEKTVYENKFGTVAIIFEKEASYSEVSYETEEKVSRETEKDQVTRETSGYNVVEITTYREESEYIDFRHPKDVKFAHNIEDDLKRRDFTINAIGYDTDKGHLKDIFGGIKDIEDKVIRTVGEPDERFGEDALRMMRAVRFSTQLDFAVSYETMQSIIKNAKLIENISAERIRDEFIKIIESPRPGQGIAMLHKLGLLQYIIPELEEGINCDQGGAHIYDVFEHLLGAVDHAANKNWSLEIRLSALFHDIGKPRTRRKGQKKAYTFYGHEVVGANMTKKIMERLKFPKDILNLVYKFVRFHMFFSDTDLITLSAVRRMIQNVGEENIWDLMKVRECDRVGMNKKEAPYRLRKYHAMIEEALRDPISVKQLKIDGEYLMNELKIKPGPRMGWILHALLEEVIEDPSKNTMEYLSERVGELDHFSDGELKVLGEKAKEHKEELEEEEIGKLHKKYGV